MASKKEVIEIISPKEFFVGDKHAPVVLMEFGEYENDECARVNEIVKLLLEKYKGKIKFSFRHFPLTLIHQRSLKASEASVAAGQEGKFWEMHNVLFKHRRNLGTTSLKIHSLEAGIENKKFLTDLVNGTFGMQVQADIKEGINRGVKNIPAFFVNEVFVKTKPTFENLCAEIEAALKQGTKKGKKVATPKAAVAKQPEKKTVKTKTEKKVASAKVVKKSTTKSKPTNKKSAAKPTKKTLPPKVAKKVLGKKVKAKLNPKPTAKSNKKVVTKKVTVKKAATKKVATKKVQTKKKASKKK